MLKGTKPRTLEAVIMGALALAPASGLALVLAHKRRCDKRPWSGGGRGPSILIPLSAISRNAPGASSKLWQERQEHRAKKGQKDESHR